jgi:hypothetical protein
MLTITDQKNLELLETQFPAIFKLHQEGLAISEQWTLCQAKMIQILSELYQNKIYLFLKCESLKNYAILFWQLPEHTAADLVTVAKKACEIPEMISVLKERKTTVSKLRKICPVITAETQKEWLDLSCECTSRMIEKTVATFQNKGITQERCRYTSEKEVEVQVGISEETFLQLEQIKDLLSQKNQKPSDLREVLDYLSSLGLEKLDPVRKAQRAQKRSEALNKEELPTLNRATNAQQKKAVTGRASRPLLPASIKHKVHLRDQNQCTEILPNGQRCSSRRFLDFHHVIPVADGGQDRLDNLITLCSAHHQARHLDFHPKLHK